jgi:hypothetical protein
VNVVEGAPASLSFGRSSVDVVGVKRASTVSFVGGGERQSPALAFVVGAFALALVAILWGA